MVINKEIKKEIDREVQKTPIRVDVGLSLG